MGEPLLVTDIFKSMDLVDATVNLAESFCTNTAAVKKSIIHNQEELVKAIKDHAVDIISIADCCEAVRSSRYPSHENETNTIAEVIKEEYSDDLKAALVCAWTAFFREVGKARCREDIESTTVLFMPLIAGYLRPELNRQPQSAPIRFH